MATEQANVVYTADTSQYNRSMAEAIATTEKYAMVVDNTAGKIAKAGIGISRLMMQGGPFGTGKMMSPAVEVAAQYEQQLSLLGARAKVGGANIRELNRDVRALARDMPIGIGGAVQQFEQLQQAGKSGEELKKLTTEMTKLGAATGEMGGSLTQGMIQFTRSFDKFDSRSVKDIGDSVTKMSTQAGASATSIVEFSNAIAPLGKTLGMTATDVIGFGTAFSRAGEDGYRAANVLSKMLADMERATRTGAPTVRGYAEAVGMTSESFTQLVQTDPTEAMTRFIEAIGAKGKDGIRILEDLGLDGVRSLKSIQNVAASGDIRKMTEDAAAALGSGATETGAKEAFNGLTDSLNKTSESMNQLVEASAKPMLGMMGGLAEKTATVTSAFAGFAQSDKVQTAVQLMTIAGGVLGVGKLAVGVTGIGALGKAGAGGLGMITRGRAADFLTNPANAAMLRQGGMLGIGAGIATGNPLMAALGAGAMFAGPGIERLRAYQERGGTGGGALRAAGSKAGYGAWRLFDMFYGGAGATERVQDLLGGKERGGRLYDIQMRRMQQVAGIAEPNILGADMPGGMYSAERQKEIARIRAEAVKDIWDQGDRSARMRLIGRTALAVPGTTARGLTSMIGGVGQLAGGLIGMPLAGGAAIAGGAVAGAAGIGAAAYVMHKQIKEAKEGASALEEFSQATGIASKSVEGLAEKMTQLQENVGSASDALKVTAADLGAAKEIDYKAVWKLDKEKSDESIASEFAALFGKQSPEAIQRAKTDLLSQVDDDRGREIMALTDDLIQGGQYNPFGAAQTANKAKESGWDTFLNETIGWYPGKNEAIKLGKASAQNAQIANQEYAQAFGSQAASRWGFQVQLPQAVEAAQRSPDKDVQRQYLMATDPDMTEAQADEIIEGLKPYSRASRAPVQSFGRALAGGSTQLVTPTTEEAIAGSSYGKQKKAEVDKMVQENQSALEALIGATTPGPSTQHLDQALQIAKGKGEPVPLTELLAEYDKAVQEGMQGPGITRLNAQQAAAARAFIQPENVAAQQTAFQLETAAQTAAFRRGGGIQTDFAAQMAELEKSRLKTGEIAPEVLSELTRGMNAASHAIELQTGTVASGQTSLDSITLALRQTEGLRRRGGEFSKDQTLAEQEMAGVTTLEQRQQEYGQRRYAILVAAQQSEKAMTRQEQDLNTSMERMRSSFQKNEKRSISDYNRDRRRAYDDFARSQSRAQADFNKGRADAQADYDKQILRSQKDFAKSMARSSDEFYKGRSRAQDDYEKSRVRATEDFNKQMQRQAEETARAMTDPFTRMSAQRTWGVGGLIGNLEEQNRMIQEQLDIVDKLRERGLSQDVVDTLKMTDAANAQQVRSMGQLTDEEIARLNEEVGERFDIGKRLTSPENNVGVRQATEDFAQSMSRMAEDFELQMQRGAEDFALSQQHAIEDFNESTLRAGEDFHQSMDRSARDFNESMGRSVDDFNRSMANMAADFHLSLTRAREDFNESIGYMMADLQKARDRAREDVLAMAQELWMTEEQQDSALQALFEGGEQRFSDHMVNTMDILKGALGGRVKETTTAAATASTESADKVEGAAEDMEEDTTDALGNVKTKATDAFGTVKTKGTDAFNTVETQGVSAMDTMNGKIDDTRLAMSIFLDTVKTNAAEAMKLAATTAQNVLAVATNTMTSVIKKFEEALGDYAWLFQQDATVIKKELVLKFDQASFDATFGAALGDADLKKPGYQVPEYGRGPGGGAGGGGPINPVGATAPMATYGSWMSGRIGDTKMLDSRNNTWYGVGGYCLRNAVEGWLQSGKGNSLTVGRLPSAAIHANRVKGQMHKDYGAPAGALYWWDSSVGGGYGHVAVSDGYGNAINNWGSNSIEKHPVASMSPRGYMGWTSPHTSLYEGGIVKRPTRALIGEAGPEAVLPLNEGGMGALADALEKYSMASGMNEQRTAGYSIDMSQNSTSIVNDSSVHTGPVTVVSDNADRMAEELRKRQRRERLASKV